MKFKVLKIDLKKWTKGVYRNVDVRIQLLVEKIKLIGIKCEGRGLWKAERAIGNKNFTQLW